MNQLINNFNIRSIFHLMRKYYYANFNGYPRWKHILRNTNLNWRKVLEMNENSDNILIATSIGSLLHATTVESLLAVGLTLQKKKVHIILCDGILPGCLACDYRKFPNIKEFISKGPQKYICNSCFNKAFEMFDSLGLIVHTYSEFLNKKDIDYANELPDKMHIDDIIGYKLGDISIGEHALAGALRFYAKGTINDEPNSDQVLKRYFIASILTFLVIERLFKKIKFTSAVFHHGIYVPQGIIGEVARKMGVNVINWNPAYRKYCFIFSHTDTYHHTLMSESTKNWEMMSWDDVKENKIMDYLQSRWMGSQDWIWFNKKPITDMIKIKKMLGITEDKPLIGLLTNVVWDAQLHYPNNAFSNMIEWLEKTIIYFQNREDLQLIIRIHPAEIRGTLPSRQKIGDYILKKFGEKIKNIIIIPPESKISTYHVMMNCNSVIIYGTKTGVELTSYGVPVIVAGEAWIRNKGFTHDVNSKKEYFDILNKLPFKSRMNKEDIQKARKYAYHFFFRRMIPINLCEPTKDIRIYKLDKTRVAEYINNQKNKGMKTIIDGIVNGKEFIYED